MSNLTPISVTIDQYERNALKTFVTKRMHKLAGVQVREAVSQDFINEFSAKLLSNMLEPYREVIEAGFFMKIPSQPLEKMPEVVSRYSLSATETFVYFNENAGRDNFTRTDSSLYTTVEAIKNEVDPLFIDGGRIIVPLVTDNNQYAQQREAYSSQGVSKNFLTPELKQELDAYNETIKGILSPIEEQCSAVLKILDNCRSTKALRLTLPDLMTALPKSVQNKLDKAERLRREEQGEDPVNNILSNAMSSIAAAALVEDE